MNTYEKSRRLNGSRGWRLGRLLSGRSPSRRLSGSGGLDSADLAALAALDDSDSHSLALGEITQTGALEHRAVDEEILGLALDRDEAESLHGVVPLHRAGRIRWAGGRALERLAWREAAPVATTVPIAESAAR